MQITSLNNDLIKELVRLHKKKERDLSAAFLIEGDHLIEEAKRSSLKMKTFGLRGCDVEITEHIAQKLSQTKSGSTVFARVEKPKYELKKGMRYFLCDGIQDPGNLGTIIRTAHSFGFDAIIVSPDSVDEYNDKVIRSTQGSIFHIPVLRMDLTNAITKLKAWNVDVYASALSDDSIGLSNVDASNPVAIVLGSEGAGVSKFIMNQCDGTVKIETSQFESLNVAVASAIMAYHLRKEIQV